MKAVTFSDTDQGNLSMVDIPTPEPGPTEVLVRVRVAGINPVDWKTRQGGGVSGFFDPSSPKVLGWDLAGEVVEVGAGVTRFSVGDRVFGMPRFPKPAGAYAEFVASPSRHLARIPDGVSFEVAGAMPLAGLTAWQAVVDTLQIGAGQRVLIHAAAGGVGHLAVQIAKARGATVWGTSSAAKHDLLRGLGVDHPIDYRNEDFTKVATEMDSVIDLVGGPENATRSLTSLRRGGRLVVIPSPVFLPSNETLSEHGVTVTWMLVEPDHAGLEALASMLESKTLKVIIAGSRPLAEMAALHALSESSTVTGKLIATINS
ncbi:MAG: NADPH:quinone reductase-like Zn-dependent oxidoreductase [Planctomycetota bacterium]|jgi:NADPH:quinone reductase-like Zn-dependent oxidoreductase